VGKLPKRIRKLILPFAVMGKDRFKPFTKDMEMASMFYLAQRGRKKGEGRVLKKPEENLAYIAEICYPIWLVPWKGRTLIFDGLEFTNPAIPYDQLPDIKAFDNDVQSSRSHEAYVAALSQNANYFQNFAGKEGVTIKGLITNPNFTHDLMEYVQEAAEIGKVAATKAILDPLLDESEVAASIGELSDLRNKIEDEIKALSTSMKLLSKGTREQAKALHVEMKKTAKEFDRKFNRLKPKVMKKIEKIQEKRDEEVTRVSQKHDRKLRALHQQRVKAEKTFERLSSDIERIEADIKVARDNKDEASEFQLTQKIDEIKKRLPALDKEIKEIDGEIENVEDAKKIDVSRVRAKPNDRIEEAMKCLHDVEAAKEARTRLEQQKLASLEEMTASIIKEIDVMIKAKEAALNEIDGMGADERKRKNALVYLSLYFVCYETEVGKRYVVYPPSYVGSMGIKTKLKGVFGAGKMKSFLQPRSQSISTLLDRLVDLTQENPVFEKEITEAGTEANILRTTEQKVGIKKGLTELKEEGWISDSEYQFLNEQI
jgi:predicted  nucleic acid-binding Zn-ribbon protein